MLLKLQTTLIWDLSLLQGKLKACYSALHRYSWLTPFPYYFRNDKDKPTENGNSLFQLAASWQANKNFLLKVKFHLPFTPSCLVFKENMKYIPTSIDAHWSLFAGKAWSLQVFCSSGTQIMVETIFYIQCHRYSSLCILHFWHRRSHLHPDPWMNTASIEGLFVVYQFWSMNLSCLSSLYCLLVCSEDLKFQSSYKILNRQHWTTFLSKWTSFTLPVTK
jgi:hypothetical protein